MWVETTPEASALARPRPLLGDPEAPRLFGRQHARQAGGRGMARRPRVVADGAIDHVYVRTAIGHAHLNM